MLHQDVEVRLEVFRVNHVAATNAITMTQGERIKECFNDADYHRAQSDRVAVTFGSPAVAKIWLKSNSAAKREPLVFWGKLEQWGCEVGMIVHVLLDGLVAHDDAESTPRVDIDGFLHIQVAEGNRLLDGFRIALLDGDEMDLAVDKPVFAHAVHRAIFQIEPHSLTFSGGIYVRGTFVRLQCHVILKTVSILVAIERQTVAIVSPDPVRTAVLPPKAMKCEGWSKPEKWCAKEKTPAKEVIRARPKAETRARDGQARTSDNTRLRNRSVWCGRNNRTRWRWHACASSRMLRPCNGSLDAERSERKDGDKQNFARDRIAKDKARHKATP